MNDRLIRIWLETLAVKKIIRPTNQLISELNIKYGSKNKHISSICRRKTVLLAPWLKKNHTWEKQLLPEISSISYHNYWDHRPHWDFRKIPSRDTYYGTIEVPITDNTCSWNTGMPFVSSVSRSLSMLEDVSFAWFSSRDTKCMHIVCSARKYSHLPNTHKVGKHTSTTFDFTKFCLLQSSALLFPCKSKVVILKFQ